MISNSFNAMLWVGCGGAIGSMLRFLVTLALENYSRHLPWGTIAVNITGSLLMGIGAAMAAYMGKMEEPVRLFLLIGLCGGFTTFSSFSLQNMHLLQEGAFSRFFLNIMLSTAGCLAATALGYHLAKSSFSG